MSYYRNYRRPYYYRHHRYRRYSQFEPLKGIFIIGVAFIFLGSLSSVTPINFLHILKNVLIWALVFGSIVWVIRKIRNRSKKTSPSNFSIPAEAGKDQVAVINTEKHGCKCYAEGLNEGEQMIADILAEGLGYKDYFIFNNLIIPSDYNMSSQIDHLVVSKFGVFVIETKEYGGWIFGSKNDEIWTQLFQGKNKFSFENPIRQNYSHIMSLRALLQNIPENVFQSIVVFCGSCEFKKDPIENVVRSENLIECIEKHSEIKLSEENIQLILGKLSYVCQTADISATQHIENLHHHHGIGAENND